MPKISVLVTPQAMFLRRAEVEALFGDRYDVDFSVAPINDRETLKTRLNLLVFTSPDALRAAMTEFIEFYNHRRYHEGIGNVTPADVYCGRREGILKWRQEQKQATLDAQFEYNLGRAPNLTRDELGNEL